MSYVVFAMGVILVLMFLYIIFQKIEDRNNNVMKDMYPIESTMEELKEHAKKISSVPSKMKLRSCRKKLVKRLDSFYKTIVENYNFLDLNIKRGRKVIPCARWLLDNMYLVNKEYVSIKNNMPDRYYRSLPIMERGYMRGYPRIYFIAVELISRAEEKLSEENIELFIKAYQENTILTIGELWAFPIMIRIAFIENISMIAKDIIQEQKYKDAADDAAEGIVNLYDNNESLDEARVSEEIKKLENKRMNFTPAFTERFVKILRDNFIESPDLYKWIDEQISKIGMSFNSAVKLDHQNQNSYQISMGNSINGIRSIVSLDWRKNFESLNCVDEILKKDPARVYRKMDFESKDYYRHKIEKISKKTGLSEIFISRSALKCAENHINEDFKSHVGYYLVDKGIGELSEIVGKNLTGYGIHMNPNIYVGIIIFLTVFTSGVYSRIFSGGGERIVTFLLALIPLSEIVISIFNWSINKLSCQRFIPKIQFENGIPENCSTVVVVPVIFDNVKKIKEIIKDVEVYYLSNEEDNLYFSILADFSDSSSKVEKKDEVMVKTAVDMIKLLNKKYSPGEKDKFYFMSRCRKYNESEKKWMGWERKRGKLMEFNRLVRGDQTTSYDVISGNIKNLYNVKYVITLDADTILPRDCAKKLVGAMEHVLNVPHVSDGKIVRGHGLIQPRISVGTVSAGKTLYSSVFSGETGIDIYTTSISDVYEDMFDEGIFTGKGIYDVDSFMSVLENKIPENTVLSHDLLEGSYARAALAEDIEFVDGYPSNYISSSKRLHRWVRGDWQLLPWIFGKMRGELNLLSKWKIFDNLRRSMTAPGVVVFFLWSLTALKKPEASFIIVILTLICPVFFNVSDSIVLPDKGISFSERMEGVKLALEQFLLIFAFLPHKAFLMFDAVSRTLYRIYVSGKNLLQWQTAEDAEKKSGKSMRDYIRLMYPGSVLGIIFQIAAFFNSKTAGFIIMPSCIMWIVSPWIAYTLGMDRNYSRKLPDKDKMKMIKNIARRTWAYFEDFVTEDTNWLAPDNYQEYPKKGIAFRTSPTNMAMNMASNIAAYDMGYISIDRLGFRLANITSSMKTLERCKGHFYNWYDIKTKKPLDSYISTVDSGNLVCYFWLLESAIEEYLQSPISNKNLLDGIYDTVNIANEEIKDNCGVQGVYEEDINNWCNTGVANRKILEMLSRLNEKSSRIIENYSEFYWSCKVKSNSQDFINFVDKYMPFIVDNFYQKLQDDSCNNVELIEKLTYIVSEASLRDVPSGIEKILEYINEKYESCAGSEEFKKHLVSAEINIKTLVNELESVKLELENMELEHDFSILYDKKRGLFSIGYNAERDSRDKSYYDLLASEARQASFAAIAKGQISQENWFKMARSMISVRNKKLLVSWSGTMFEYLMPLIIIKSFSGTLLEQTYKNVVEVQRMYGDSKGIPWGISECAYYSFDSNSVYQYKAIGVPETALDRNIDDGQLVVAPYASVMSLLVDAPAASQNIERLQKLGLEGRYGLYEAFDCVKNKIIKCFMVHHQGMSLLSIDNVVKGNILQNRFHRVPRVRASEMLLQERIPKAVVYKNFRKKYISYEGQSEKIVMPERKYSSLNTKYPEVNLMSNGKYSVMVTNNGGGYSRKGDMFVGRWREDPVRDNTGMFFYIKNINSNEYWSAAYQPCKYYGENYKVVFSEDASEFQRVDGNIKTCMKITVSQEDDVEIREIYLTNKSQHTRSIEVTSYMEVTLASYASDIVHPAFGNLFIETEFVENPFCIAASRRPRGKDAERKWAFQTVCVQGKKIGPVQYETNRERFIGRDRNLENPRAMDSDVELSGTQGAVIDPIISIRVKVEIDPGKTCRLAYTTGVSNSKNRIVEMARKYSSMDNIERMFQLSLNEAYMRMKYLGLRAQHVNIYQTMASKILFMNDTMKKRENYIVNINRSQSALWKYGISGDLPIVFVITRKYDDIHIARQILSTHEYLSIKGLRFDLVILDMEEDSYMHPLQDEINKLIDSSHARNSRNQAGGAFLLSSGNVSKDDERFLKAVSRLVFDSSGGDLSVQLGENPKVRYDKVESIYHSTSKTESDFVSGVDVNDLQYFNGIGGFSKDGRSYFIVLRDYKNTPAPWINVISNKSFGFHISESGSGYTWNKNSSENKLTSWNNDAVVDGESEAFYLGDNDSGEVWSISPQPVRDSGKYVIEHGFGYSVFKHSFKEIYGEFTTFAALHDSIKFCIVEIRNDGKCARNLSAAYYTKLVLGVTHESTAQYIFTGMNYNEGYVYAENPYSQYFGKLVCYMKMIGGDNLSYTGDRFEFLGKCGSMVNPYGMREQSLSNSVGAGFDPCIAEKCDIFLQPGEGKKILVMFGQGESIEDTNITLKKYGSFEAVENELAGVKDFWNDFLGRIQVSTPDKSMDIMLNGWLMYQVLGCRYWARSAFYQSGGAYGFRDQLQDVMSIGYLRPDITRQHIVYSSTRQYLEGDVQHWWHPVEESGIRTRFSDDLLWLPYVTADYIENTGDYSVLYEETEYLEDMELKEGEDERYGVSGISKVKDTIYKHCVKAINRACRFGQHNIPLMGSGDWNDGMNTVGNRGKGESVWLGWFLYSILCKFSPLCLHVGDDLLYMRYRETAEFIRENLEKNAWDGSWYRRAYFDDGTPLGSVQNEECRIDCIVQAWSVISKGAKKSRAKEAMEAVEKNLVKRDKGMVLLLNPAFDRSSLEPGYIKGYLPGIRENGGQYTHGAIWSIASFAELGYNNKAYEIFSMLNPVNHSKSYLNSMNYRLEPYVAAADVYNSKNNEGRGGWSWYTGAAGWMYRSGIECILGLKLKGSAGFTVSPCVPDLWKGYSMTYKKEKCIYNIAVSRDVNNGIWMDGRRLSDNIIPYKDGIHDITVKI